jgi:hypothetical protein
VIQAFIARVSFYAMPPVQKRFSYSVAFKLQVVQYAKGNGNRAAERHFGPPPTEKMIREWRKQENQLIVFEKNKHSFRTRSKMTSIRNRGEELGERPQI